jgi:CheY-like chemotaxis protein
MLIDDNQTNLTILGAMLKRWGVGAIAQRSGGEALAYCHQHQEAVDCIIMDYVMPGLNGFETASALSKIPQVKDVPIIMLSSSGIPGDAQKCRELGIQGYLLKPASHDEIYEAICGVLNCGRSGAGNIPVITRHSIREAVKSLSIMLVEDNKLNQQLALALLKKWGHRIDVANNGVEALELHAARPYDLILMDLQMPVMGGFEATAKIRERERQGAKRTIVVAMTANALEGDREKCIAGGMDDYLSKPFKAEMFSDMLKKYGSGEMATHPVMQKTVGAEQSAQTEQVVTRATTNFDYAKALNNADREVIDLIAAHFLTDTPKQMAVMRQALQAEDFDALRREAHAMAGLLGNFMAEPAQGIAARIDHDSDEGIRTQASDLLDALEREIALLAPHLNRLTGTASRAGD